MKKWTIEDSNELYNINGWGRSYFGVNEKGNMYVTPGKDDTQIDLREVMDELSLRDVESPVLLRFPDILDRRIETTWNCFRKASEEYDYQGENYVVYPIKVNQMQPVVEEPARNPSSTPSSPCSARATPSSSATAIRTRAISNWPCWPRRWASASSSSWRR